jgi:hypothetical protein
MNFFQKIQNQSIRVRKAILWTCVVIVGLIFLSITIKNLEKNLETLKNGGELIKTPNFNQELNLPKQEIGNDFKEIDKLLQKAADEQKASESNTLNNAK